MTSNHVDERRADDLRQRQQTVQGLSVDEATWLQAWEEVHKIPPEWLDDEQVGSDNHTDLALFVRGFSVYGPQMHHDYTINNVRVAGGWSVHLDTEHNATGWARGWSVEIHGTESFSQALGIEPPVWLTEPLGPFYTPTSTALDEHTAYKAALNRLTSLLAFVSAAALDKRPYVNASLRRLRPRNLSASVEPTVAANGYVATGKPTVEGWTLGPLGQPGGWAWSIASDEPTADHCGYSGSVHGLSAFCAEFAADCPAGADEPIAAIRSHGHRAADYQVVYHRMMLRLLTTLAYASGITLDSYSPAAAVIDAQQKQYEAELEYEVARELTRRRLRLRNDRPPANLDVHEPTDSP